jgi:cytochrome c oxidase subunit 2
VDSEMGNFIGLDRNDPAAVDDIVAPQNVLLLPEGKTVLLRIRSLDVIHSFFLPNFRVKQDAVPGMTVQIWFTPKETGDFEIACAEHCGLGHYRMRGQVHVVAAADFDKTLKAAAE